MRSTITQDVFGNPAAAHPAARDGASPAPSDAVAGHWRLALGRGARRGARHRPRGGQLPRASARGRRAAAGRRGRRRALGPRPPARPLPLRPPPRRPPRPLRGRRGAVGGDRAGHAAPGADAHAPSRRSRRRGVAGAGGLRGGARPRPAALGPHPRARSAPAGRGRGPRERERLRVRARGRALTPARDGARRDAALLGLGALAYFLALGLGIPTLPRYLTGPVGGSSAEVGVAVAAFSVTAILARPLVAPAARRVRPSVLLAAGAAIVGVATAAT